MIHDADSPEAYLKVLEDDWRREKLLAIRALLFDQVKDLKEGMQYKMLSYTSEGRPVAIMNAQKGYVSVYMDDLAALDPDGSLLAGKNCGKSCLRLRKTDDIDVVGKLVERRLSRTA